MDNLEPSQPEYRSSLRRSGSFVWLVVIVLIVAALGYGGWRYFGAKPAPSAVTPVVEAAPDAGAAPPPAPVPEDGDALLRALVPRVSKRPELAKWLEHGLFRRMAAAMNLLADGQTPAPALAFAKPKGDFKVKAKKKKLFVNPASYARYNRLTKILTSIDPAATASVYENLKPYFEAAYQEIGPPGRTFDSALRNAITAMLAVEPPPANARLVPVGLTYAYADPALEKRSGAAKQLMRFGPANMRAIQAKLNELQKALVTASSQ